MGRFQPGQSGNPRGRPPGEATTQRLRKDMISDEDLREILEVVIDKAKGGDLTAAALIIDRKIPKLRVTADLTPDQGDRYVFHVVTGVPRADSDEESPALREVPRCVEPPRMAPVERSPAPTAPTAPTAPPPPKPVMSLLPPATKAVAMGSARVQLMKPHDPYGENK